ncbi:hypothetical protein [Bacteroides uniformis]|uniref:hypothetical protein n=1 Tax=Bacteroides uniformis TaxID=820 RepID=UPI001923C364|nr:hypothetical protein [Bacteroides uniformis]
MAIINEINEYNKRKVQPSVTSGNLAAQSQQLPSLVPGKASGGNSTPDVEDNPRGNISQYDSGNSPVVATPAVMNPREDERGGAPSASPAAIAGNSADDTGRITYESSGIAPTVTSGREYREDALRTMGEEEFKDVRKQMNASDKEYWTKQMEEHPESSYAILQNMFASDETPQEKSKRERREQLGQVFANLGNVIGNAANLYYAHRGGIPVDLNSGMMYENERMRRIKEKRDALKEKTDAILMNARLGDLSYARSVEDARRKAEADRQSKVDERAYDLMKFNANLSFNQAKEKARKEQEEARLKETERHNKTMENIGWSRANSEDKSRTKVVESAKDSKGDAWGRSSKLTSKEAKRLVESYYNDDVDLESFRKYRVGSLGEKIPGEIDYNEVVAYMENKGLIPPEEWESMGFKRTVPKKEQKLNWGKNENKTDW